MKNYLRNFIILIAVFFVVYLTALYVKYNNNSSVKYYFKSKDSIRQFSFDYKLFKESTYDSIESEYVHNYDYNELLFYSIIASNKLKNGNASYNVFYTIANLDTLNRFKDVPNLDFLDDDTKLLALKYLLKASNEGQKNAKLILGKYYLEGKYIKKDVENGEKLIHEGQILP